MKELNRFRDSILGRNKSQTQVNQDEDPIDAWDFHPPSQQGPAYAEMVALMAIEDGIKDESTINDFIESLTQNESPRFNAREIRVQYLKLKNQLDHTEGQINEGIATNEKDIEIIADLDAFNSRKYLLDRGRKEEIMVKYKDRIEKLSPNTPEEKYELLVNTVEYHSSDEAKKEFERITNEYYNHPLVYYKDIYQRSSNYYI